MPRHQRCITAALHNLELTITSPLSTALQVVLGSAMLGFSYESRNLFSTACRAVSEHQHRLKLPAG
jgi:hypothetical protein